MKGPVDRGESVLFWLPNWADQERPKDIFPEPEKESDGNGWGRKWRMSNVFNGFIGYLLK
ncbi:hypothetical protein Hanom_Chr16g01500961 [Helianthus anomalus]